MAVTTWSWKKGDLVLTDSVMPSRMAFGHENTALGLLLPYETLRRYSCLIRKRCSAGVSRATISFAPGSMGTMLRAVWAQVEQGLPPRVWAQPRQGTARGHRHDLRDGASVRRLHIVRGRARAQIKRFIEGHLRDADLSASSVAAGLGLSARYHGWYSRQKVKGSPTTSCGGVSKSAPANSAMRSGRAVLLRTRHSLGLQQHGAFHACLQRALRLSPTEYRRNPPPQSRVKNALGHPRNPTRS